MNLNYARYIDKWVGLVIGLVLFGLERVLSPLTGRSVPSLLATTPPRDGAALPTPRRILCMKFYGLGNSVMLLPVLQAVRERFPDVEIDFMTLSSNAVLLERSGMVNRTLGVDVSSVFRFVMSLLRALRSVRARGYDTIVDFEQFVKISSLIGYVSGARERVGFNTDGQRRGFMYTTRVVYTDSQHMSEIFARLTHPLGVVDGLQPVRLLLRDEERNRVGEFLSAAGVEPGHFPLVAMHPGIGMNFYTVPLKRWEPSSFAAVADGLAGRYGAMVVFTGQGEEERGLIAGIRARMQHRAIDACNRFTVCELAALAERCHFVVCNDTATMHLAALVGTPVVAMFGPTAPLHYGPRGDHDLVFYRDLYCSPCLSNYNLKVSRCTEPVCMRGIRPDEVLAAIEAQYLGEAAAHREWLRERARSVPGAA